MSRPLLYTVLLGLVVCSVRAVAPGGSAVAAHAQSRQSAGVLPPIPGSYVALGASETYGVGATPRRKGYAFQVARALHAKHFLDAGIPGATLNSAYQNEVTSALDSRPQLTTVFFGVNDIRGGVTLDAFLSDLRDLATTLRRGRSQVLIIGMPDLSLLPVVKHAQIGGLRAIVNSWNAGMKRVAGQTGARFLDLRRYDKEIATHANYIAPDGLHPSNAGHRRLAQVVVDAIQKDRIWSGS